MKFKLYQREYEIKQCPICEADPFFHDDNDPSPYGNLPNFVWYFHVQCTKCGLKSPGTQGKKDKRETAIQDAVDIWNAIYYERIRITGIKISGSFE